MNQASREQRNILFNRENESALLNKLGPGPAKYSTLSNDKIESQFKYSIPKVSKIYRSKSSIFRLQEILVLKKNSILKFKDQHKAIFKNKEKFQFLIVRRTHN